MLNRCNIYYTWNATSSKCSCPSGWLMSPTLQCYYKSGTAAAWDLAELDCMSKNAHLISVNKKMNQVTKLPSYKVTKLQSDQVTKLPSYKVTVSKCQSDQVTKLPSYKVTVSKCQSVKKIKNSKALIFENDKNTKCIKKNL